MHDFPLLFISFFDDAPAWLSLAVKISIATVVFLLIVIPSGRAVEEHTNERAARWVWNVAIGFLALMLFVGMSGVGQVYESGVRQTLEPESARASPTNDEDEQGEVSEQSASSDQAINQRDPAPLKDSSGKAAGDE